MAGYLVEPEVLQRDDALLQTVVDHAREALAALRACADDVFATWHGGAAVAFRLAWEEWLAAVIEMVEALAQFGSLVGASGRSYAGTEAAVRSDVARTPA